MRGLGRRSPDYARRSGEGASLPLAPFSARLIHANYADRGIARATGVSGWEDVVGTRDFVQADTTKQPAYGVFTTSPALSFDGVNDFMASPSLTLAPYAAITIAFSAQWTASGTAIVHMSSVDPNVNPGAFYVLQNGGTYTVLFRNSAASRTRAAAITAGVKRFIFVLDTAGASAIPLLYINGVSSGSAPGAADVALGNFVHYMGMFAGTSLPWTSKIGDSLIYGDALSVAEIGAVDTFLASRCV